MAPVVGNALKLKKINIFIFYGGNIKLMLFQNNITPDPSTPGTVLTEADFSGYASIVPPTFTTPTIGPDGITAYTTLQTATFTAGPSISSSQTIYGAAVLDTEGGGSNIFIAEKFGTPIVISNPGDSISYQLTITDSQG